MVVVLPAGYCAGIAPTGRGGTVRLQIRGRRVAKLVLGSSDAGWDRALGGSVDHADQIGRQCEPHHHLGPAAPRVRRLVAEASVAVRGVVGCEGEEPRPRPHWDALDALALQVVRVIADLPQLRVVVFVAWNPPCVRAIREQRVGVVDLPAVASPEPRSDGGRVAIVAVELALGPAVPVRVTGEPVDTSLKTKVPMLNVFAVVSVLGSAEEDAIAPQNNNKTPVRVVWWWCTVCRPTLPCRSYAVRSERENGASCEPRVGTARAGRWDTIARAHYAAVATMPIVRGPNLE